MSLPAMRFEASLVQGFQSNIMFPPLNNGTNGNSRRPGHSDRHFVSTASSVKTTLAPPTEQFSCQ